MFLGIEIGGTKLQLGVGPGDGTIVALERTRVDAAAGGERIRQQIIELVPALLSRARLTKSDIEAVGIGFGGPVDAESGTVAKSHQVEGWEGFPLADWCRRELGWPTVVHNDADAAGLAEACFGAGRGYSPIFYITIGSGIGGGLIIDQKIYRGAGAGAGEIGHILLPDSLSFFENPEGTLKEFENPRPIEWYCSGWSIARRARSAIEFIQLTDSMFHSGVKPHHAKQLLAMANDKLDGITSEMVGAAARTGNPLATWLLASTWQVLGWAIAQVVTLVCPRRIVIGGGVSDLGHELLFAPLREQVARFVFAPFADCFDILHAELGETVVVHGALRLARQSTENDR